MSRVSPVEHKDENGISSAIHDAARITDWQTVLDLCGSQPEAAAFIGADSWTALHHACNRRCPLPNVVEALIQAYPDALVVEEEKGWLPLHYACRFKAPKEVVRLLLHSCPDKGLFAVSRPDRKGRTPLYYAVRYDAPPGVAGLLLDLDPSAVLEEDENSDSPLALVWDSWAEKLDGKRTLRRIIGTSYDEDEYLNVPIISRVQQEASKLGAKEMSQGVWKRLKGQRRVLERWNKVNVFLKAAFGFVVDGDWEMLSDGDKLYDDGCKDLEEKKDSTFACRGRKWRILHAIAAIKCHPSLFSLAAALHPDQAVELDKGDLRTSTIYKTAEKFQRAATNLTALHLAASSRASGDQGRVILAHLLAMNPEAIRSIDSEGSTPLHRIAENADKAHWIKDGMGDIHSAHPESIALADFAGRLPLHRAAIAISHANCDVEEEEVMEQSKICNLLREDDNSAHHRDTTGCFSLHLAARHGRRICII